MVVEAEVHENYYSEIESHCKNNDIEVADEDLNLDQNIVNSQKARDNATPANFAIHD